MKRLTAAIASAAIVIGGLIGATPAAASAWDFPSGSFTVDDGFGSQATITIQHLRITDGTTASGYVRLDGVGAVCSTSAFTANISRDRRGLVLGEGAAALVRALQRHGLLLRWNRGRPCSVDRPDREGPHLQRTRHRFLAGHEVPAGDHLHGHSGRSLRRELGVD